MNLLEDLIAEIEKATIVKNKYSGLPDGRGLYASAIVHVDINFAIWAINNNDIHNMVISLHELRKYTDYLLE